MTLFFVAYFQLLRNPVFPVTEMPRLAIDRWIPFTPQALWVYFTLWVYVALPPALLATKRELAGYTLSIAALCGGGLAVFALWPTAVPPPEVELRAHAGFGVLHGVDAAGNAFPSLHVATAAFSAAWLHRLLGQIGFGVGWRLANAAWVGAIVWSTVAVRQHVVLDVAGGLLLAALVAAPALRWHRAAGGSGGAAGEYDPAGRSGATDDHDGTAGGRGKIR